MIELLYDKSRGGTVVWVGFAVAAAMMILALAINRKSARLAGLAVMIASTLALLAAFATRWFLSGQPWYLPPLLNQFEALVGSALLGAAIAIAVELVWKRGFVAPAAAMYATVVLLACWMFGPRTREISAPAAILDWPIMAAHVATIIVGYALAGMTVVISLAYLGVMLVRGLPRDESQLSAGPDLSGPVAGGVLAAIDRSNLIVSQLACWMILLGTMLGAYWADRAWGRWWGWDVKETWTLITCLAYLLTLHVRFVVPPRWRGLATAIMCVIGGAAMLFNWLAVNYLFRGLHSYA